MKTFAAAPAALRYAGIVTLCACLACGSGCAPMGRAAGNADAPAGYAATIREALRSYASDMQGYYFRATPVSSFGVGSIYLDDVSDPAMTRVESGWYLGGPETWLEAQGADRPQVLGRMIAEGSLGAFSVGASNARAVNAQAGLAVLAALSGSASLDYRKGVETSFQASEVRSRRLNWAEFESALNAGRISPAVARVVRDGRFVVVAADLVLIGYRAEIVVDENVNPALAASLRTRVLLPQRRGTAGASMSVSESRRGHFVATASAPVVAAVLFKRPPAQGKALGDGPGRLALEAWPTAPVNAQAIEALEGRGR